MDDEFERDIADEPVSGHELRATLRQVGQYRALCNRLRGRSYSSLLFGGLMLGFWYFVIYPLFGWNLYSTVYFGLAAFEVGVGLFNLVFPSAEGIAANGLLLMGFGLMNLGRVALVWMANGNPFAAGNGIFTTLFGVYWLFQGAQQIRSYINLRRSMPRRPTRAHLRWFDDLVKELRDVDPADDPKAVEFPTDPPLRGKLLGDSAFFLDPSGEVLIVAREQVVLERTDPPDPDRPLRGDLSIGTLQFPPFKLGADSWRNYAQWKREGGVDVDPPVVRRTIDRG